MTVQELIEMLQEAIAMDPRVGSAQLVAAMIMACDEDGNQVRLGPPNRELRIDHRN